MPPIKGDTRALTPEDKQAIDAICAPHPRQQSSLLRILWDIQKRYGHVFPTALERAAAYCQVSPSRAYGAMSFYTYFRTKPLGEHIVQFCEGPICYSRGNKHFEHELREKLGVPEGSVTSPDGSISVLEFECHGSCHLAPYLYVDGRPVARATEADLERIATDLRAGGTGRAAMPVPTAETP